MRRVLAAALAASLLLVAAQVQAFTKLEGEYFFLVDLRKQDRRFAWDFDSNNNDTFNNMQFRLFNQPAPGAEAFVKFEAEWNEGSNSTRRPVFQYREAHLRLRRELGKNYGIDSYLFSRQDRFWVDNNLIRVVDGGAARDNGNAQGVRVDFWAPGPTNVAVIASDFSSQSNFDTGSQPGKPVDTDDAYAIRVRRELFDNQLRLGFTWNRKNTRFVNADQRVTTEVFAGDLRYTFRNVDLFLEYAEGQQRTEGFPYRSDDLSLSKFSFGHPDDGLPDDAVVRGEIRTLKVGNPRAGYFNLAPEFWYLGPQFRNQMGDGNSDETGYYLKSWYLIPGRAITWTNDYLSYVKRVNQRRHVTEFLSELYIEYVNGFTSKFFYRNRTTRDWSGQGAETVREDTKNDDFFAEMQVESRLAWLRVQFRIKDLDTRFQKELASIETSVNISEKLKMYNRFAFGNDPTRQRKGLFSELQYRPRPNLEIFLAYGPFWIGGGSNPVFEGNLEGSSDNRDLIRLQLKGTF